MSDGKGTKYPSRAVSPKPTRQTVVRRPTITPINARRPTLTRQENIAAPVIRIPQRTGVPRAVSPVGIVRPVISPVVTVRATSPVEEARPPPLPKLERQLSPDTEEIERLMMERAMKESLAAMRDDEAGPAPYYDITEN